MYDGVTAAELPTNGQLVGGYVDGEFEWSAADWARFPNAVHVPIAVFSSGGGVVLDVEQGNATPAQSVDWALARRRAGVDPSVYMNTSTWPQVEAAFQARGVAQPHYWVADYDGSASIPAGAVAKQYRNTPGYDVSSVADYWPGVDPAPNTPAPAQEDEDTVYLISVRPDPTGGAGAGIFTVDGGVVTHVDGPSFAPLQARFGAPIVVSATFYDNLRAGAPASAGSAASATAPTGAGSDSSAALPSPSPSPDSVLSSAEAP
jgi:hypothetical protein